MYQPHELLEISDRGGWPPKLMNAFAIASWKMGDGEWQRFPGGQNPRAALANVSHKPGAGRTFPNFWHQSGAFFVFLRVGSLVAPIGDRMAAFCSCFVAQPFSVRTNHGRPKCLAVQPELHPGAGPKHNFNS